MQNVNLLTALYSFRYCFRMRIREYNFAREVIRVAEFEKDQVILAEIVLNACAFGAITGFASARYSKMRVGVLISVKILRWLGIIPGRKLRLPRRSG